MSHCMCFQIADFKELDKAVKDAKSVVIVGGGFLGSELACALGHRGTCTGQEEILILKEILIFKAS